MYAHAFQLKILLDLIERKFGEPIAKLVEASFKTLLDETIKADAWKMFGQAFEKIDEGRNLGPVPYEDIPLDEDSRLDARVADQILSMYTEKDRPRMRIPLANCLRTPATALKLRFPDLWRLSISPRRRWRSSSPEISMQGGLIAGHHSPAALSVTCNVERQIPCLPKRSGIHPTRKSKRQDRRIRQTSKLPKN